MIRVDRLEKHYGDVPAVRGLSFRVEPGEVLGLVGPNGAGKTTTIRSIAGIIVPSQGTIQVGDFDLAAEPVAAKSLLAFIPDEPHLFEYLTVEERLRFVGRLYQVADVAERIPELLGELELTAKRTAFPGELSRGMRQKLAIACGLLHRPRALLLDEPLTGLDPVGIRRMKATIVRRAEAGAAVILSSHLLHLVEEICTRVLIMNHGQAVAFGTVAEMIWRAGVVARSRAGGRVPRADRAGGEADRMIRTFGYLAWRSAYNRTARQIRPPSKPALSPWRSSSASRTSGFSRSSNGPGSSAVRAGGERWIELLGALALLGALLWAWVFGVERRVLRFTPAEVTFLFPHP